MSRRSIRVEELEQRRLMSSVGFEVTSFLDERGAHSALYEPIRRSVLAAGTTWASLLRTDRSVKLEVQINFSQYTTTAHGFSPTRLMHHSAQGRDVEEVGAAVEIRTGNDPNATEPDIRITFGESYLLHELWFDPDPLSGTAVPLDRTDAYSVMLHELGHALGFDSARQVADASLPAEWMFLLDEMTTFDGENPFFMGRAATVEYGGPVPLTYRGYSHLGNIAPHPGEDLASDLMSGVQFLRGHRYTISSVDAAILADLRLPIAIPGRATIAGSVFEDLNGDGIKQRGEHGLAGRQIFIDTNNDRVPGIGESRVTTDQRGHFHFHNLTSGRYRVRQVVANGWRQTRPSESYVVEVARDQSCVRDFGQTRKALISGSVFNDINSNGRRDDGEFGLRRWRIFADLDNDRLLDPNEPCAVSDNAGNWNLRDLSAGTYVIRIKRQTDYALTSPAGGSFRFSLQSGTTKSGLAFGERRIA